MSNHMDNLIFLMANICSLDCPHWLYNENQERVCQAKSCQLIKEMASKEQLKDIPIFQKLHEAFLIIKGDDNSIKEEDFIGFLEFPVIDFPKIRTKLWHLIERQPCPMPIHEWKTHVSYNPEERVQE